MPSPTPTVYTFGYHTVQLWGFARSTCEQVRARIIKEWAFAHSPAEAVSPIREISLLDVELDWLFADSML